MELISREEAIKRIQKVEQEPNYQHDYEGWRDGLIIAENIVDELPTIEERKESEWINDTRYSGWTCKHCNYHDGNATDKYCPNCGAKMIGK